MTGILDRLAQVLPILPSVLVVLLALGASWAARRLLAPRPGDMRRGDFRRQIVQLVIGLVATVLLLIVLPVDPQLRGQLLSLFGIMFSAAVAFASTTLLSNVMAGIMLKGVRNFRAGDFVRVGEHFGRVTERGLVSTEIQTEDRDLVTLPNLTLVTSPVKVVRSSGTLVSAEVSLGYDVDHRRVGELLRDAAATAGLDDPFVLVTHLGDFSVTYRAAGKLTDVGRLLTMRSELRRAMLDGLHGAGVEIVSPNFMNQRALDPSRPVIPRREVVASSGEQEQADGPRVEDLAFDKAEEAATLEQLQSLHERLRKEIAALADGQDTGDRDTAARRQEELARRLARVEAAITRRQAADDPDGE
jgi:small-conductance mechanosensitive channel